MSVSRRGAGYIGTPGIYSPEQIEAWSEVCRSVHFAGGRIVLQLWHVGRVSHPDVIDGEKPVAPSAVAAEGYAFTRTGPKELPVPQALESHELPGLVAEFRDAARNAKEAGFDIRIKAMEFASSLQAARDGEFEAYLIFFSGRADADGNMYPFLFSGGEANWGRYSNPLVDRLINEARIPTEPVTRRDVYGELWKQVQQDLPIIYLWTFKNVVVMKRNITGFTLVRDGLIRFTGVKYSQ
jgi:hypothetical protein